MPVSRYTRIVARPKSPEGKRVTICVKVSESDAAAIDVARGELSRSAFGRESMLAAVHGDRPVQAGPVRQRRQEATGPVSSVPVSPGPEPVAPRAEKCSHPKARVLKGQCRVCFAYVGKA